MKRTTIAQLVALVLGTIGVLMLFTAYHLAGFPLAAALTAGLFLASEWIPVRQPAPGSAVRQGDHPGHLVFDPIE